MDLADRRRNWGYLRRRISCSGPRVVRRAALGDGPSRAEIGRIAEARRSILREAIGKRGTTFRSHRDLCGTAGRLLESPARLYGREGEACYTGSTPIRNVIVGQRAKFSCPQCQK